MIKNKKIMMLATTDNMIWQFMIPHIEHLKSLGNSVDCVCSNTGFWTDELRDKFGYNVFELPFERNPFKKNNLKAYKALKKLQKENGYDLIYCQQPVGGLMGRLIARKFKIPVIYTAHGFFFFKGASFKKRLLYKNAEKFLARYTDCLITINEEDYQASLKFKAKSHYKISGIGVDLGKYDNLEIFDKSEYKRGLNIDESKPIIITIAEMIKRKNYPTILRALKKLKEDNIDYQYLICGTGILREELENLVKELGIEENVKFLGYRKDINKIMQIADIFVLTSYHEGLTMAIMEAMNFKLPVVTSTARGNLDLIEDGKGGYVSDAEDDKHVKEKLKELILSPDKRQQMGEYNYSVVDRYSLENVKEELEKIYEDFQFISKKKKNRA